MPEFRSVFMDPDYEPVLPEINIPDYDAVPEPADVVADESAPAVAVDAVDADPEKQAPAPASTEQE